MICPTCGTDNSVGFDFCPICGEKIVAQVYCVECGEANKPDFKFCKKCGANLEVSTKPPFKKKSPKTVVSPPDEKIPPETVPNTQPVPAQTIIIQKEEKKRSRWLLWLLLGILLALVACVLLLWFDVVNMPGEVISRLPSPIQQVAGNLINAIEDRRIPGGVDLPGGIPKLPQPVIVQPSGNENVAGNSDIDCSVLDAGWVMGISNPHEGRDGTVLFQFPLGYKVEKSEKTRYVSMFKVKSPEGDWVHIKGYIHAEGPFRRDATQGNFCYPSDPGGYWLQCDLPYIQGEGITYAYEFIVFTDDDTVACEKFKEFLETDVDVKEDAPSICSENIDLQKFNFWYSPTNSDLNFSIINGSAFQETSYSIQLSHHPATYATECRRTSHDLSRLDCYIPGFTWYDGFWDLVLKPSGETCNISEKQIGIPFPTEPAKCPSGETFHDGWPYNSGCCTDGCWCIQDGKWGCWQTCASNCGD